MTRYENIGWLLTPTKGRHQVRRPVEAAEPIFGSPRTARRLRRRAVRVAVVHQLAAALRLDARQLELLAQDLRELGDGSQRAA